MISTSSVDTSRLKDFMLGLISPSELGYSETDSEKSNASRRIIDGVIYLACDGMEKTLKQWSEYTGIKKNTLYKRLKRGWDIEDALFRRCKKENRDLFTLMPVFLEALQTPNPYSKQPSLFEVFHSQS